MATMSTHGLSVLATHSVALPVDPKTGLKLTFDERPTEYGYYGNDSQMATTFNGPMPGQRKAPQDLQSMLSRLASVDPASLEYLRKAGENPDENFYQKLLELKNEQKKILQKCEKIYLEKTDDSERDRNSHSPEPAYSRREKTSREKSSRNKEDTSVRDSLQKTYVERDGILTSVETEDIGRSLSPTSRDLRPEYEVVSLSQTLSKPPTGRPSNLSEPKSPFSRPRSAPLPREIARSLDELRQSVEDFKRSFDFSDDEYVPDDTVSEPYTKKDQSLATKMWQNFSVEDYAPRKTLERTTRVRPSSATITLKEKKTKDDTWRHRLTIPKPFSMTIRDENKDKKKTKTMLEFEEKVNQKLIEEEEEMKKKFKARPVPAHVYLPLYDEIQEKTEERRRHVRQSSADMLRSQEKPFSFTKREIDRKNHLGMERDCSKPAQQDTKQTFKAKPVPKAIFDNTVDDKLMEEEEYRKIRIKMRAEELLRSSSLPPNMHAREQVKEQLERRQKMKSKRKTTKGASRPRINHDVPNYDALYRHFQQELNLRKNMKEATITKPFHLETERTSKSARDKIKKQLELEESSKKENRWPYASKSPKIKLGHMSSSLDALPAKSTRSADCRSTKTRRHMQHLSEKELREIEEDRHRRVREMKLRREIQGKTKETPRPKPEDKMKEYKEAEHSRMEQYEQELKEMQERVQRRPLLFEQESQVNARKKAEKKFNATLRSVGLDEDFVEKHTGSRSASIYDYSDDYADDDDFEDTAVKHTDETYTKRRDSTGSLSPVEA